MLAVYELPDPNTCIPTLEPPPANDKFAHSTVVASLPFTDTISTKAATLDPGEPQPGSTRTRQPDAMRRRTQHSLVLVHAERRHAGSRTNHRKCGRLRWWQSTRGSSLGSLTPVACSAHLPERDGSGRIHSASGVPYHFQVAALSFSVGTVTFSLAQSPSP